MRKPKALWIEGTPEACWDTVRQFLSKTCDVYSTATIDGAFSQASNFLDIIFFAQAFPDQYPASRWAQLRQRFPLAGLVQLLGPWSDGASRNSRPLPGVIRKRWHEVPLWLGEQIHRWTSNRQPDWYGDWKETRTDAVRKDHACPIEKRRLVCIAAAHETVAEPYCDLLAAWQIPSKLIPTADAIIPAGSTHCLWDETGWAGQRPISIERIRLAAPDCQIIVVANALRPAEKLRWMQLGGTQVLGKPLDVEQLRCAVDSGSNPADKPD